MILDDLHDFFVAAAGVAGALIGLLFVAVSVAPERLAEGSDTALHRIRASAAFTAFTNALVISLTGLISVKPLRGATLAVSVLGASFVLGSLIQLLRWKRLRLRDLRDELFLVLLAALFVFQFIGGIRLSREGEAYDFSNLALLVLVAFLIGIARAWELVRGPSIGLRREVLTTAIRAVRPDRTADDSERDGEQDEHDSHDDERDGA